MCFCSIFYEKEGFYCQPKDLPLQEFGGVAVALGQKVNRILSEVACDILLGLTTDNCCEITCDIIAHSVEFQVT